jgi:outer membrane protein assembly factor BamD
MMRISPWSAVLLAVLAATACASTGPKLAQMTPEELFAHGQDRAEARKWRDAISAFERFVFEHQTHPRYQEARYELSRAHFGAREYITAATEYARLAMDFPAGPWADESRFGVCESYYRLSPRVELDQEYTTAAVEHCEALLSYHPDSPLAPRAQEMIGELRNKLAEKVFRAGAYYERRDAVDSAIKYFKAAADGFPTTAHAPRALLRLVRIYEELQWEDEAQEARQRLLKDYPASAEAKGLEKGAVAGT